MYPVDEIKNSQRWQWVKAEWSAGNYKRAVTTFFNGWPDMTYPWRERAINGVLLPRGEASYNRLLQWATEKYGHYNDLRNLKNVLWREFAHLQGAFIAFIPQYGIYRLSEYLFPEYGWIGFLLAWIPLVYTYAKKEFVEDVAGDGKLFPKNFIDFAVWLTPGLIFWSSWFW